MIKHSQRHRTAPHRVSALFQKVVVITGASSGIGRATARAFAEHGTRLVLCGRNVEAVRMTAGDCARRGAHSLVVGADVTDANAMADLARKANDAFGGIDVWINNAGVGLFGAFQNASIEAHRRVVETDLLGAMNGAAAVLPYFLRQQRGVLISNISIGAFAPVPYAAAYTAAKFGLRGFMASLRQEVAEHPDIHVCSIFPAVIDTPAFGHGANVSGADLHPSWPIFPPEKVAEAMVRAALRPAPEIPVGWPSHMAKWAYGIAPVTVERVAGRLMRNRLQTSDSAPTKLGNLFEPSTGRMTARGGWRERGGARRDGSTALGWAGVAGVVGAITWALTSRRKAQSISRSVTPRRARRPEPVFSPI